MAQDWKKTTENELTAEEKHVIWDKGTERAGTGEYNKFYPKEGHFICRACKSPLYSAKAKFDSGCGWPAFDKCYTGAVKIEVSASSDPEVDNTFGMKRIEIMCARCGGHLGHVFKGEKFTPTDERHCVNSLSVRFVKESTDLQEDVVAAKV